jgi:HNH endonuclease
VRDVPYDRDQSETEEAGGAAMKRFLVTNAFGHPVDDVDLAEEAKRLLEEEGDFVFVRVEPFALRYLHYLIEHYEADFEAAITRKAWREQRHAENPRCDFCGNRVGLSNATVDHRVALSENGPDTPDNWVFACGPCNSRKGRLSVREFLQQIVNSPAFAPLLSEMAAFAKADEPAAA